MTTLAEPKAQASEIHDPENILILSLQNTELSIAPDAETQKQAALSLARSIETVSSPAEQSAAVNAAAACQRLMKIVEKSRKAVKEPVIKLGKKIDDTAKVYAAELEGEYNRLTQAIRDYQIEQEREAERIRREAEDKARREAEARAREEREEAERLRREAEKVSSPLFKESLQQQAEAAEQNAVKAEENVEATAQAAATLAVAPARAEGASVQKPWEFEVLDINALVAARPDLCHITPKTAEINKLIRQFGVRSIPGLRIFQNVKVSVRSA